MLFKIITQYLKDPDNEIEIEDIKDIKLINYLLILISILG